MAPVLARNWWAIVLRGLLGILFGIVALVWPGITLLVLVLIFGAYALIDGFVALISAFRRDETTGQHVWLLLEGLVGIAAGILTFLYPGMTTLVLLYIMAAWAVVTGVLEILAALRLRAHLRSEWALALGGLASIVFGVILFVFPAAGALAWVWLIGAYAIIFGILLLAFGLRLRGWHGKQPVGPNSPIVR